MDPEFRCEYCQSFVSLSSTTWYFLYPENDLEFQVETKKMIAIISSWNDMIELMSHSKVLYRLMGCIHM